MTGIVSTAYRYKPRYPKGCPYEDHHMAEAV